MRKICSTPLLSKEIYATQILALSKRVMQGNTVLFPFKAENKCAIAALPKRIIIVMQEAFSSSSSSGRCAERNGGNYLRNEMFAKRAPSGRALGLLYGGFITLAMGILMIFDTNLYFSLE